ncbi:hypothetical protein Ade02nite_14120 [Paractinoplanes deccanensis]|uniref:Uncharacterized protein n=1 Tax=Paractinoplanes deccanensis TaxID=113561 RepID=A0ABQ3XYE8_9ACTN|nr:hypothetical protein [Actinoplanes deccanensis]GID72771.1 hypothetical protein Ade02nite_14120 [Actinoplanes deccanensis]
MHDIDRALFEAEGEFESEFEDEFESFGEAEGEDRETALATELLEISSEEELDRFIGSLLNGAVSAARNFARSSAGKAVGGMVKQAARQVLPRIGQALGDAVGGKTGGAMGQRAGKWLSRQFEGEQYEGEFGVQTEGLSAEDREFELARTFVRFADEAARRAASAGPGVQPQQAAQQAAIAAARTHLPGLLRPGPAQAGPRGNGGQQRSEGRWVRRGSRIVILDV